MRNVIMLDVKGQVPGHGWGCFGCDLPFDGASAVLCDPCIEDLHDGRTPIRFACRGYPAEDGRVPIEELNESHAHDMAKHAGDPGMPAPLSPMMEGAVCIYAKDGALIMPGREDDP